MATNIEQTLVSRQKKVIVKSEEALKEMEENGQLEPFTDYYTPDEDETRLAFPIGTIFASAIPQTDARVHLLDGSYISQDGIYKEFAEYIKSLVADGYPISCSETQFESDVSSTGNCGKFVINNSNATIRLPRITKFIQGLDNISNIGTSLLDEFKSHNHDVGLVCTNGNAGINYLQVSNGVNPSWDGTANGYHRYVHNTGGSETRPKATQYPYYIVLASGYKSSQNLDVDKIMNDKQDKLSAGSVALGFTWSGQNDTVEEYYVSSDGKTWYRKWASGWKECGGYVTVKQNTEFVIPLVFSTNLWTALATVVVTGAESMSSIIIQTLKYSNYCALKVSSGIQTINWYQNDIKYYCCGF